MRRHLLLGAFIFMSLHLNAQTFNRRMEIKSCSISITTNYFTATTFIEYEFYNPGNQEIEGLFIFQLLPNQVITAFQLDLNGKYRDGSIEEKWKATTAYNTIVGKRIDPALLTTHSAGQYLLNIYPVPAKGTRKVTLTIGQALSAETGGMLYKLPWASSETVQQCNINVKSHTQLAPQSLPGWIQGQQFTGQQNDYQLSLVSYNKVLKDTIAFQIPYPTTPLFCTTARNEERVVAYRCGASYETGNAVQAKTVTVFWDVSANTYRNQLLEMQFLHRYLQHNSIQRLTIIPFNHKTRDTAIFYAGKNFTREWQKYLQQLTYNGATRLGSIDLRNSTDDVHFIFSDGRNTYGRNKPIMNHSLLYAVSSHYTADKIHLEKALGQNGGSVIDLARITLDSAVRQAGIQRNWLTGVRTEHGPVSLHQELPLRLDAPVIISSTIQSGDTLYLDYIAGKFKQTEKIPLGSASQSCGDSSFSRIALFNYFPRYQQRLSWNDLLDFGLREKVVTLYTAYIVLERVSDYIKYNITPPKELEDECLRMNYVKKDTRSSRQKIENNDAFAMIDPVIITYNDRLRNLGLKDKQILLSRERYELELTQAHSPSTVGDQPSSQTGNFPAQTGGSGQLSEVVVVGHSITRQNRLTGSISVIGSMELSPASTVDQALQGRIPGLSVTSATPGNNNAATLRLRGIASVSGIQQPLWVVDGTPFTGNINDLIQVTDIESVTVLKSAQAASLYGSRAANGAIVIVTKKRRYYPYQRKPQPYKLEDLEDVEYIQLIKNVPANEKMATYERLRNDYLYDVAFYLDMAQHFYEIQMPAQAFEILLNAAEQANGELRVQKSMGYILQSWGMYEAAIRLYTPLIEQYPYELSLQRDLALSYWLNSDYQQALDCYYKALGNFSLEPAYFTVQLKASMLIEMNALLTLHKDSLNSQQIPPSMIKPFTGDLRIVVDGNDGIPDGLEIKRRPYKNAPADTVPFAPGMYFPERSYANEYIQVAAVPGNYRIMIHSYNDYYSKSVPSIARIMVFKNIGTKDQTIETRVVSLDNQAGKVVIGEVRWK